MARDEEKKAVDDDIRDWRYQQHEEMKEFVSQKEKEQKLTELAESKDYQEYKRLRKQMEREEEQRYIQECYLQDREQAEWNAELQKQMSEATAIRSEEKAENTKVIEDAKVAQVAVEKATQVLEGFYGKQAASMLQSTDSMSEIMRKPYKGMGAESGGVFGMLEVILSDFARLETDTSSAESQAQAVYDKFISESTESKEIKEVELEHKDSKKQETDERNRNLQKELALTQEELDAALQYFEKLKADCVDTGMSYEARVEAREEEIQSLKEALRILNGEDLA